MIESKTIYIDAFENYKNLRLDPLPIPYENGHPTKGPKIAGWQTKAANGEYISADFAGPCNIGILLGGTKNLTDIDCDSPEAVLIGNEVLKTMPPTFTFGRASKSRSHYIFSCERSLPTERITDPVDGECVVEYRCTKQDGERGHQTVVPPSLRYDTKTGEVEEIGLEDDSTAQPAFVEADKLHRRFQVIGAAALLAKHFPAESERHNTILALAGVLARSVMPEEKATMLVNLAYRYSGGYNHDGNKAEADVKAVYKAHAKGSHTHLYGYPKLTEIMPKPVVDKVLELLGIEGSDLGENYNLTDAGNGRRLVDKHKDEIRYCVDDHEFYVWDGVRWRKDVIKKIRELAKAIAADIRHEAELHETASHHRRPGPGRRSDGVEVGQPK
jgi:hypothetical protein